MAFARSSLFDASRSVICHCISCAVRRLFLFQERHWREALMQRLLFLTQYCAIDVFEAAILGNHLHLVAATHPELAALWSDEEVARRYRSLCPDHRWRKRKKIAKGEPAQPEEIAAALGNPELIARWRQELASLSFFHKLLKQKIARAVNLSEGVSGHCWEGRFKSIVALDAEAVVAHMLYVALNPVRAGLAKSLDECEFATVRDRVNELKDRIEAGEFTGDAERARARLRRLELLPAMPCDPGDAVQAMPTLPGGLANPWLGGRVPPVIPGASLAAYLRDIDDLGRIEVPGKTGVISRDAPRVLSRIDEAVVGSLGEAIDGMSFTARFLSSGGELMQRFELALMSSPAGLAWGNFSGSAGAIARHARLMGRHCALAILGHNVGDPRRIRAATDGGPDLNPSPA